MRWNYVQEKRIEFGDTRHAVVFAFLPTVCQENHKHWLEFVVLKQWRGFRNWWPDRTEASICPDSEKAKEFFKRRIEHD